MRQVINAPSSREISPQLYAYLESLGLLTVDGQAGGLKGGRIFIYRGAKIL